MAVEENIITLNPAPKTIFKELKKKADFLLLDQINFIKSFEILQELSNNKNIN